MSYDRPRPCINPARQIPYSTVRVRVQVATLRRYRCGFHNSTVLVPTYGDTVPTSHENGTRMSTSISTVPHRASCHSGASTSTRTSTVISYFIVALYVSDFPYVRAGSRVPKGKSTVRYCSFVGFSLLFFLVRFRFPQYMCGSIKGKSTTIQPNLLVQLPKCSYGTVR